MKIIFLRPSWKRPLHKIRSILLNEEYTDCVVEVYDEWYSAKGERIINVNEGDYHGLDAVEWKCGERIKAGKFVKRGFIKKNRSAFTWFDLTNRDSLRLAYRVACIYRNVSNKTDKIGFADIEDLMIRTPRAVRYDVD